MHGSFQDLIDRIDAATGDAHLALPGDVQTGLVELICTPCIVQVRVSGQALRTYMTPPLRALARMRDPAADAHAGWLVAVLLHAGGVPLTHEPSLPASTRAQLTPEGRAWLIQQTRAAAATKTQLAAIDAAWRVESRVKA